MAYANLVVIVGDWFLATNPLFMKTSEFSRISFGACVNLSAAFFYGFFWQGNFVKVDKGHTNFYHWKFPSKKFYNKLINSNPWQHIICWKKTQLF